MISTKVTVVQPSWRVLILRSPSLMQGSMVNTMPGLITPEHTASDIDRVCGMKESPTGIVVEAVVDVGRTVEEVSDAVPEEISDHRAVVLLGVPVDCSSDSWRKQ